MLLLKIFLYISISFSYANISNLPEMLDTINKSVYSYTSVEDSCQIEEGNNRSKITLKGQTSSLANDILCNCANAICDEENKENDKAKKRVLTTDQKQELENIKIEFKKYQQEELRILWDLCSRQLRIAHAKNIPNEFFQTKEEREEKIKWCAHYRENKEDVERSLLIEPKWSEENAYYLLGLDDQAYRKRVLSIYETLRKLIPAKQNPQESTRYKIDQNAVTITTRYPETSRPYKLLFETLKNRQSKKVLDDADYSNYTALFSEYSNPKSLAISFKADQQLFDRSLFENPRYFHSHYNDNNKQKVLEISPYVLKTKNAPSVIAHEWGHFLYKEMDKMDPKEFKESYKDVFECLYKTHQSLAPNPSLSFEIYRNNGLQEDFADLVAAAYMNSQIMAHGFACEIWSISKNECDLNLPVGDSHAPPILRVINLKLNSQGYLPFQCSSIQDKIQENINADRKDNVYIKKLRSCLDVLNEDESRRLEKRKLFPRSS